MLRHVAAWPGGPELHHGDVTGRILHLNHKNSEIWVTPDLGLFISQFYLVSIKWKGIEIWQAITLKTIQAVWYSCWTSVVPSFTQCLSPQLQDKLVVSMSTVSSVPAIPSGMYSCMVWSWGGMGHSDLNAGFGNWWRTGFMPRQVSYACSIYPNASQVGSWGCPFGSGCEAKWL